MLRYGTSTPRRKIDLAAELQSKHAAELGVALEMYLERLGGPLILERGSLNTRSRVYKLTGLPDRPMAS